MELLPRSKAAVEKTGRAEAAREEVTAEAARVEEATVEEAVEEAVEAVAKSSTVEEEEWGAGIRNLRNRLERHSMDRWGWP